MIYILSHAKDNSAGQKQGKPYATINMQQVAFHGHSICSRHLLLARNSYAGVLLKNS